MRWALLGNAVSVHVARWLGERFRRFCIHKYFVGPKDRKLKPAAASVPSKCTVLNPLLPAVTHLSIILQADAPGQSETELT